MVTVETTNEGLDVKSEQQIFSSSIKWMWWSRCVRALPFCQEAALRRRYLYVQPIYRQNADMTSGLTCHSDPKLPFVVQPWIIQHTVIKSVVLKNAVNYEYAWRRSVHIGSCTPSADLGLQENIVGSRWRLWLAAAAESFLFTGRHVIRIESGVWSWENLSPIYFM